MNRQETIGIVHLGIGAFFRAFGLPAIQTAMQASGDVSWHVAGVSLRSPAIRDKLAAKDFRYHAVELGPTGRSATEITVLKSVRFLGEDRDEVLKHMTDPNVRLVSLTVTEKGYCYAANTGEVDFSRNDVIHDLENPDVPSTAPGLIVEALRLRRIAGIEPFVCLSCDNHADNGEVLKRVVLGFAQRRGSDLAPWIERNVSFPSTMVDRIVPATTRADIDASSQLTGFRDEGIVVHEPFFQWVVEDNFGDTAKPPLELAGVNFVSDVRSFEHMKLRLLNATHSALAYLGVLAGKKTVFEAINDPAFKAFVVTLWQRELIPSLPNPPDIDLTGYTNELLKRYSNPAIAHATIQIAMDGSQKMGPRILGALEDNLESGRDVSGLALVVAAWIRFLGGKTDKGEGIEVNDQLAEILTKLASEDDPVSAVLTCEAVFPPALLENRDFVEKVRESFHTLKQNGVQETLETLAND